MPQVEVKGTNIIWSYSTYVHISCDYSAPTATEIKIKSTYFLRAGNLSKMEYSAQTTASSLCLHGGRNPPPRFGGLQHHPALPRSFAAISTVELMIQYTRQVETPGREPHLFHAQQRPLLPRNLSEVSSAISSEDLDLVCGDDVVRVNLHLRLHHSSAPRSCGSGYGCMSNPGSF